MRNYTPSNVEGFSVAELLITLFIAAAFVATGYQLYSVIITNSSEARLRSTASNIAYDTIRRYSPQATNPCTEVTPSPTPSVSSTSGLPSPTGITVTYGCPYGLSSPITRIIVTITYGNPQQQVQHATMVYAK